MAVDPAPSFCRGDVSRSAEPAIDRDVGRARGKPSKTATVLAMLKDADGATLAAIMTATGWQAHSVRGFLAGVVRKKLGLTLLSERIDGGRRYRIKVEPELPSASGLIPAATAT